MKQTSGLEDLRNLQSPDARIDRIRQTVHSMQRRIQNLDILLEEQIRTLDLEQDLFRPPGLIINRKTLRILQIAGLAAAILAFVSGFVTGMQSPSH
jgi:hypothetical protein